MFTIGPSNARVSNALPKKRPKPDEINQVDTTKVTSFKKVKSDSFLPEVAETPLQTRPLVRSERCNSLNDLERETKQISKVSISIK